MKKSDPMFSQSSEHERHYELCAIATSGSLTDEEWIALRSHLAECPACKERIQEYREIAKTGMPFIMPDTENKPTPALNSWPVETAKQELFARMAEGETAGRYNDRVPAAQEPWNVRTLGWRNSLAAETQSILRYAASAVLVAALAFSAYWAGRNRGEELGRGQVRWSTSEAASLRGELDRLLHERTSLDQKLNVRTSEIESVKQQLKGQSARVAELSALHNEAQRDLLQRSSVISELTAKKASITAERDAISRALQEAESSLIAVQQRLDALQEQRTHELLRTTSLETRIEKLSARLKESNETVQRQEQFLASSRDIRELVGARELYIADVFDVNREGKIQKPFGRVFYTRGKSLIFYAFDLDQQPGVREASVFQAWGRRGPQDKRPLNMGIFYLDNEASKRWVLRFDDAKLLRDIDAVFVTVEPRDGRRKPSGGQLLFASLRTPPNHP